MKGIKKSETEWVLSFRKEHGNKYEYIFPIISNSTTKIIIICPIHKEFQQSIYSHAFGKGCKSCFLEANTKTQEQFLKDAKSAHGDTYYYDFAIYINSRTKVKIGCKTHGIFEQLPGHHTNGTGCRKCLDDRNSKRLSDTIETFTAKAKLIHGNEYNYSFVEYESSNEKIKIGCREHGIFEQTPSIHLQGGNCPTCLNEAFRQRCTDTLEDFVRKSKLVHGDEFDYSRSIYLASKKELEIGCKIHGFFWQCPKNHISGKNGCPQCRSSISKSETEWLNSLSIPQKYRQRKLKIDGRRFKLDAYDSETNSIYEFHGDYWHGNPKIFPANEINSQIGKTFGELYQKTINRENFLKEAGYNLIIMWEQDWKEYKKNNKGEK